MIEIKRLAEALRRQDGTVPALGLARLRRSPNQRRRPATPGRPATTLSGAWLQVARAAWLALAGLNLVLLAAAIPAELARQEQLAHSLYRSFLAQLGLTPSFFAVFCTTLDVGLALAFAVIGFILFWRRSDDWMALLIGLTGMTFAALFVPSLVFLMRMQPAWQAPAGLLRAVGLATSLIGPYYLFPNGRFVPRLTRWLAGLWVAATLAWLLWPGLPINPIYMDTWLQNQQLGFAVFVVAYATGVAAQVYRYRRLSGPVERQQTRWVVLGITAGFVSYCIYQGPPLLSAALAAPGVPYLLYIFFWRPVYYLLIALVPICIGISVLRYRLWDIDLIIRRTLIYGVLTALLAGFYGASVLILQRVFRLVLGQGSVPAIVAATLGLATLFGPLRERVQEAIDRRFYRQKYDAARVLARFSVTVRDEVDLDGVTEQLLQAVADAIQPAHASVWLRESVEREMDHA